MNLQIGQEVCILNRYSYTFGWKVIKITEKSGQIIVQRNVDVGTGVQTARFNKHGNRIGNSGGFHTYLETDVVTARALVRKRALKRNAVTRLMACGIQANEEWSKTRMSEAVTKLEEALFMVKSAVDGLPAEESAS